MINRTYYDKSNGRFSLKAHMSAKEKIYPKIFPHGTIKSIKHENGSKADLREKIDVKVIVEQNGIEVCYTIQERWRRVEYANKRDVTITAYNNESGIAAEFYKGEMHFVLYGYWDEKKDEFGEVIFCNFPAMRYKQLIGTLYPGRKINPKGQDFFTYHFSVLRNKDCVEWSNFELKKQLLPQSASDKTDYLELQKQVLHWQNEYNRIRKLAS